MDDKPLIGIYRIYNIFTGMSYIGQSKDILKRWETHERDLMEGKHHSKKLQKDFSMYGPMAFIKVIIKLYSTLDRKVLDKDERMYIAYFNSFNRGYNCTRGNN